MSDSYQEIDLDKVGKVGKVGVDANIEIVEEEETEELAQGGGVTEDPKKTPAQNEEEDDEDGGDDEDSSSPAKRQRLSRTQRLKASRDTFAEEARKQAERVAALEAKLRQYEDDAVDGAGAILDVYIKGLDDQLKTARIEYDQAFDAGDRNALWEATAKMTELVAEKKNAEKERRAVPKKGNPTGGEETPQTRTTTDRSPAPTSRGGKPPEPTAAAKAWHKENAWFGKDRTMTLVTQSIDAEMVAEGFDINDPDYFTELDTRLRRELPHKFKDEGEEKPKNRQTVMTNKSTPAGSNGKVRVSMTAADKKTADQMGISYERFALQKWRKQQAEGNDGYTEIS